MFAIVLALAVSFTAADAAPMQVVTEDVDTIAVCHVADGAELIFFFAEIQGEWACLDHRWASPDMAPRISPEGFELAWLDESEWPHCYRIVRAPAYVETHERVSPLAERNDRPWFVQLLEPGLKQPGAAK